MIMKGNFNLFSSIWVTIINTTKLYSLLFFYRAILHEFLLKYYEDVDDWRSEIQVFYIKMYVTL